MRENRSEFNLQMIIILNFARRKKLESLSGYVFSYRTRHSLPSQLDTGNSSAGSVAYRLSLKRKAKSPCIDSPVRKAQKQVIHIFLPIISNYKAHDRQLPSDPSDGNKESTVTSYIWRFSNTASIAPEQVRCILCPGSVSYSRAEKSRRSIPELSDSDFKDHAEKTWTIQIRRDLHYAEPSSQAHRGQGSPYKKLRDCSLGTFLLYLDQSCQPTFFSGIFIKRTTSGSEPWNQNQN